MEIFYSRPFNKILERTPLKIQIAFRDRLGMFLDNPNHPFLQNHKLSGEYENCRSINITGDWRAIFKKVGEFDVIFIDLGTHSQLYQK